MKGTFMLKWVWFVMLVFGCSAASQEKILQVTEQVSDKADVAVETVLAAVRRLIYQAACSP